MDSNCKEPAKPKPSKRKARDWKALELRRRIRERQARTQPQVSAEQTAQALARKSALRALRGTEFQHKRLNSRVRRAEIDARAFATQCEQQLRLESIFRALQDGTRLLLNRGKEHVDALGVLEARLKVLRTSAGGETAPQPFTDQLIQRSLHVLMAPQANPYSLELGCGLDAVEAEQRARELRRIVPQQRTEAPESAKIRPQAPRFFELVNFGVTWASFRWGNPILKGGSEINAYELSYQDVDVRRVGKKLVKELLNPVVLRLDTYILKDPLPKNAYTLTGLRGGRTYASFRIRCRNDTGWSAWTSEVDELVTQPPEKPGPVMNFHCLPPKSSSCELVWFEPFSDGGADIVDYELAYTETVEKEAISFGGKAAKKTEEKRRQLRLGHNRTEFALTELRGDSVYKNITIRAINAVQLVSEERTIDAFRTEPPSRLQVLQTEMKRARAASGDYIDSDFFTGTLQREVREEYIKRLEKETLAELEKEKEVAAKTAHAQRRWKNVKQHHEARNVLKDVQQELVRKDPLDRVTEEMVPGFPYRRKHYNYKIATLGEELKKARDKKEWSRLERFRLAARLRSEQERIIEVQAEYDRAITFRGRELNSSTIHGSVQRFTKAQLLQDLSDELQRARDSIATAKNDIINGEMLEKQLEQRRAILTDRLKERRAARAFFESEARVKANFHVKRHRPRKSRKMLLRSYLDRWLYVTDGRKHCRFVLEKMFAMKMRRYTEVAMYKWRHGRHRTRNADDGATSLLERSLRACRADRSDMQADMRGILFQLRKAKARLETSALTKEQQAKLVESGAESGTELVRYLGEKHDSSPLVTHGDALLEQNQFERAVEVYMQHLEELMGEAPRTPETVRDLGLGFARLGAAHCGLHHYDRAIFAYDRCFRIASETSDLFLKAESSHGMAAGYFAKAEYNEAIELYESAGYFSHVLRDSKGESRAFMGLFWAYRRQAHDHHAEQYRTLASHDEQLLEKRVKEGLAKLDKFGSRLVNQTAEAAKAISFERSSAACIRMRREIRDMHLTAQDEEQVLSKQKLETAKVEALLKAIRAQLEEARSTDKDTMRSALVHEEEQIFDVEELKVRLTERDKEVSESLEAAKRVEADVSLRISNVKAAAEELSEELMIEEGALMQKVRQKELIRCVALNAANEKVNEVTGTATGGVELVVCAIESSISIFDIHTGKLVHVFPGDDGNHIGALEGHQLSITALCFYDQYIYSGGSDAHLFVWDAMKREKVMLIEQHETTITQVCVDPSKIVTGSADMKIRVFDSTDGRMLCVLHGHSRSITALESHLTYLCSGGADGEIRIWDVANEERPQAASFIRRARLRGHYCPITCLRYGKLELVSGARDGHIFIWWLKTGTVLRRCKAHDGPVNCLQFDATRVVSGGADATVRVTDITTGESIQVLRGHEGQVCALQFDNVIILSGSADGSLRQWKWGSKFAARADKYHIYDRGDSLVKLAKAYGIEIGDIVLWNGIRSAEDLYVGQRLLVQKGDPNNKTEAELKMKEKRQRQEEKRDDRAADILLQRASEILPVIRRFETSVGSAYANPFSVASRLRSGSNMPLDVVIHGKHARRERRIDLSQRIVSALDAKHEMEEQRKQELDGNLDEALITKYRPDRKKVGEVVVDILCRVVTRELVEEMLTNRSRVGVYTRSIAGRVAKHITSAPILSTDEEPTAASPSK